MTLVLSLLSPECVVQVSDRRLVWFDQAGQIRRRDDEKNKSVLWCHRMAFAYTGLAELGMERRTDLWLANRMAEWEATVSGPSVDQGELVVAIRDKATEYFRGPRISRIPADQRRHAFVGVGWGKIEGAAEYAPYSVVIANFVGSGPARERFIWDGARLEGDDGHLSWFGQDLTADEQRFAQDRLRTLDPYSTGYADHASAIMGETIRAVAHRSEAVGRGLLITVLPRGSLPATKGGGGFLLAGSSEPDTQTFLYVAPDDTQGVQYGPTYTCGGRLMTNFAAYSGPLGSDG